MPPVQQEPQYAAPPASAVVFGGSGFIGSAMLRLLAQRGGAELLSIDLNPPRAIAAGVRHLSHDVRKRLHHKAHAEVIYNFAAVHTTPGHQPHEYYETNVSGALNVTDFARRNNINTIVFTSSIAVYGATESQKDEQSLPQPESDYGRSKLLAEEIHRLWLEEDPARQLIIVRPAVVFGDGERGNFDRMLRLIKTGRFIYPGRTDTVKSCGYVEELTRSIEWVRDRNPRFALFNFAYPERTSIQHIAETISRTIGKPAPRLNLPFQAMELAARPFEALARVGIDTGINRNRLRKLTTSTNIYPGYLMASAYPYATTFEAGVREWLNGMTPARVR